MIAMALKKLGARLSGRQQIVFGIVMLTGGLYLLYDLPTRSFDWFLVAFLAISGIHAGLLSFMKLHRFDWIVFSVSVLVVMLCGFYFFSINLSGKVKTWRL